MSIIHPLKKKNSSTFHMLHHSCVIVFLPTGRFQPQHKELPLLALPTLQICAPVDDTVSSHLF